MDIEICLKCKECSCGSLVTEWSSVKDRGVIYINVINIFYIRNKGYTIIYS